MLSEKILSSLREYIDLHLCPETVKRKSQYICAPCPSASSSKDTAQASFRAVQTESDTASAEDSFLLNKSLCDECFHDTIDITRISQYVTERRNPTFSSELMRLIDESGCRDSEIYSRAGIDRRHFSKIRSNPDYHPSKQTAAAFCLALRLSREQTTKLLSSAGYSLSSSEIFDLIISFCLENKIYDLTDVNTALVYFSLKPIGASE